LRERPREGGISGGVYHRRKHGKKNPKRRKKNHKKFGGKPPKIRFALGPARKGNAMLSFG